MLIVHGTWLPRLSPEHSPRFFMWGERRHVESAAYTFLEVDDMVNGMKALYGEGHTPFFSDEKARVRLAIGHSEEVRGVALPFEHGHVTGALQSLVSFGDESHWGKWGMTLGPTLQFWHRAARFVLQLLATEHYIPSIVQHDEANAVWDALIADPRVEHHLNRMMIDHHEDDVKLKNELTDFIQTSIDLFVRESLDEDEARAMLKQYNPRYAAALTPTEHWLEALFAEPDKAHDPALEWLVDDVVNWHADILSKQNETAFRTCLRLAQPAQPTKPTQPTHPAQSDSTDHEEDAIWTLDIMLQATDDPSLLVPAHIVWQQSDPTLTYLNYRFAEPQERLLFDLGKASTLFTPLQRCLQQPNPARCELTTEEAYDFLTRAAGKLHDEGFGVFIPDWWRKRTARLGVKMKVGKSSEQRFRQKSKLGFNELLDYEWELAVGDDTITAAELEQLAALKQPLVQVRGRWVEFNEASALEAKKMLQTSGQMKLSHLVHTALQFNDTEHAIEMNRLQGMASEQLQPYDDVLFQGIEGDEETMRLIAQLSGTTKMEALPQPDALKGQLRPYQFKGFSWLIFMRKLQFGVCLADDMGLGKTIQWIGYALQVKQNNEQLGPALLICPTSVIANWEQELSSFAPTLNVWIHHGADRLKGDAFVKRAEQVDVIITSYALAMRDEETLTQIEWDNVTLDEAQHIKNTTAKQTQSIRKLAAYHRIALTGTPVENRLSELWSIIDFLNPGYLGTKDSFVETFEVPIERDGQWEATQALQQIIQPFVLRRLKSDRQIISDLPLKDEQTTFCMLTKEQVSLYEACMKSALHKVEHSSGMERRGAILSTITHLKQICNHPAHYLGENELHEKRSGKLMQLVTMLNGALEQGERVLIFSQYASMAMLLQQFLEKRFQQEVLLIHGRIAKKKRDAMINRFQHDPDAPFIFVLSLKTGGFGLNLTRANHVIHYDRWWNPAVENQATDRAYRIGQQRDVNVYKYVCAGTLEERIDQLMIDKQVLASRVVGIGEAWMTELSTAELKELFALRNDMLTDQYVHIGGS